MKIKYVVVFILPVFMLLLNIQILMYDFSFYQDEFDRLGVYDKFSRDAVDENARLVLDYVKEDGKLNTDFFNEKEKIHLGDFRSIVKKIVTIFYVSLIILVLSISYLVLIKRYKSLFQSLALGFGLTLILLVLLALTSVISFSYFFDLFHELYPNDLYLLNPDKDNLIVLFPEKFFLDVIQRILLYTGLTSIVLLGLSILAKKRINRWESQVL